jgi:hypothetical protein
VKLCLDAHVLLINGIFEGGDGLKFFKWASALFSICLAFSMFCGWLITNTLWTFSNSILFVLCISLIYVIYLSMKSYKTIHGYKKIWVWLMGTVSFSISGLLIIFLLLQFTFITLLGGPTHLTTSESPNKNYRIDFIYFDAGAMGTFGIRGELNGPLGFKKQIYYERHATEAKVTWVENDIVNINGHQLNLKKGEYFGYIRNH